MNKSQGNNGQNNQKIPEFTGKKKERYEALVQLRDELVEQVRDLSSSSLSYRREPGEDLADVGSENFSRDMGLALMTEEGRKIVLIQDAIQRMVEGTYGTCVDCGKDVGEGRLDAIPYAKLCIDCKAARESNDFVSPEDEKELVE